MSVEPMGVQSTVTLWDVVRRRAPLVGARHCAQGERGLFAPNDPREALGLAYDDPERVEREYFSKRTLVSDLALAARTVVARALAPRGASTIDERVQVLDVVVDNVTVGRALELIVARPPAGRARVVHFVHPHAVNLAASDASLRAHLQRADIVLPDGVGLRIASGLLGTPLVHNVNGTDLLPLLCEALVRAGVKLSLIGGAPGVAEACREKLTERYPGLVWGEVAHGFIRDEARDAVLARVRRAGGVVLVGMGTPIQERWTWEHLARIDGVTVVTVGGLFDFYSGSVRRAPQALREVGLEWLWRLWCEPRRLAARYLLGNPLFLARVLVQRARAVVFARRR
ncbi:MAG: WecB/TagA/CpsF family glycosyltransferase [Myxococcales bacterium]|nr:WecB/TagA/CpsF family glycosyltransferase [Myxococcales bacterium]